MRHRNANPKLGRTTAHRKALLRNMVTSLFREERITTTVPKAKEARRWAERMITVAKRGNLHARRRAASFVRDADVLKKLFDVVAPRYATRPGGYTRILKTGFRAGDNAPMSILELVGAEFASAEPVTDAGDAKQAGKAPSAKGKKVTQPKKSTAPKTKAPRGEKKTAPKPRAPVKGAPKQIGVKKSGRSGSGGKSG